MSKRRFFIIILTTTFLVLTITFGKFQRKGPPPKIEVRNANPTKVPRTTVVASSLDIPWGLSFLLDGSLLFTERAGRVRMIDKNGSILVSPVVNLTQVKHIGEGGLLGIAAHPNFNDNRFIYLYYTYSSIEDNTLNRVSRFKLENNRLIDEEIIVDTIPGASNHNGGRIKFGPDNFLYITTGDAQEPSRSQDKTSLAGKILRVTDEGKTADSNPFGNLVYSYGHRNPQGLAWDNRGRLWATEHGRSGILPGLDEINLIETGKNYGWPTIQGNEQKTGMEKPRLHSGSDTWAPSGATFAGESFFFGGLRGQTLYEAVIKDDLVTLKEYFKGEFGRIREVVLGPDGFLYVTTSNRDGRGIPKADDDKIIKVNVRDLKNL